MRLLRKAYFQSIDATEDVPHRNIAFISDMGLVDGILKAVLYQANANNRKIGGTKNTFLFR